MTSVSGREVAVVTGGSSGVARATVQAFAAGGYDVAVLARGRAGVDGAVRDGSSRGGRWPAEDQVSCRARAGAVSS